MTAPGREREFLGTHVSEVIRRVLDRDCFELGPEQRAFEEEFANFCGRMFAVGVGSGTDAVEIALRALGIGPGDEVLTAPNSCISTTAAIRHAGANVGLVDIDARGYNLDPSQIESRITRSTKALMPVHMYGHPAEMDTINQIASQHGLFVIEDSALATGAAYKGRSAGALGDVACFSFAPPKILGAYGDAGIIVTANEHVASLARIWSNYGESTDMPTAPSLVEGHDHLVEGRHSHMDELQAAVLRAKLPFVRDWVARRREVANHYNELFAGIDVVVPFEACDVKHAYRNYTIRVRERDSLRRTLAAAGIESRILYSPPIHLQTAYKGYGFKKGEYPVSEEVSEELVCLPIHPWLRDEEVAYVATVVRKHVEQQATARTKEPR